MGKEASQAELWEEDERTAAPDRGFVCHVSRTVDEVNRTSDF